MTQVSAGRPALVHWVHTVSRMRDIFLETPSRVATQPHVDTASVPLAVVMGGESLGF